jgi:hypothetical protein
MKMKLSTIKYAGTDWTKPRIKTTSGQAWYDSSSSKKGEEFLD